MTPYLGQITLVAFNFAPVGWAICNGSLLSIAQNSALFTLIGTTYGGDGLNTFALPDLRSRIPLHQGQGTGTANYVIGQASGSEQVTLLLNQIPAYLTRLNASPGGATASRRSTACGLKPRAANPTRETRSERPPWPRGPLARPEGISRIPI